MKANAVRVKICGLRTLGEALQAVDIAHIITFVVTRHWRTAINEVLVRPTEQAF